MFSLNYLYKGPLHKRKLPREHLILFRFSKLSASTSSYYLNVLLDNLLAKALKPTRDESE